MKINIDKIKQLIGYRFTINTLYIYRDKCISFELLDYENMNIILVTFDKSKYSIEYTNSENIYNILEIKTNDTSKFGEYIRHINTGNNSKYKSGVKNSRELYYMDGMNKISSFTYVSNYTYKTFQFIASIEFEYLLTHRDTISYDSRDLLSSLYDNIKNRQYTTNSIKNIVSALQLMDNVHTHIERERHKIRTQMSKLMTIYRDIIENERVLQHKISILKSQGSGKPSIKGIHKDLELGKHEYILYKKLDNLLNVKNDTIKQYNILRHRHDNILLITDKVNRENSLSLRNIQVNLKILTGI